MFCGPCSRTTQTSNKLRIALEKFLVIQWTSQRTRWREGTISATRKTLCWYPTLAKAHGGSPVDSGLLIIILNSHIELNGVLVRPIAALPSMPIGRPDAGRMTEATLNIAAATKSR
jgi:hypothetical protein